MGPPVGWGAWQGWGSGSGELLRGGAAPAFFPPGGLKAGGKMNLGFSGHADGGPLGSGGWSWGKSPDPVREL